jgi:glutamate N-acetyltransferase/amino-acid N-acetyltransferase
MKGDMRRIRGGVTAPAGFKAAGVSCGIKKAGTGALDLALIASDGSAAAAAVFTTNRVKAAPVIVSRGHVRTGGARVIVANSGNANACTGRQGMADARSMARMAAGALGVAAPDVLVCSTGRIGVPMPMEKVEAGIKAASRGLKASGGGAAARAILTSDSKPKEIAVAFSYAGRTIRVGGIAKGAGMIAPNMATMLAFLTTDAAVDARALRGALVRAVEGSFNRITVDGDMSTNDTVIVLANGRAWNSPMVEGTDGFDRFEEALVEVADALAQMIVADGEGVTRFVEVHLEGAASARDARLASDAIARSSLVKCAWYGGDPNWGRIMDAIGYSGAKFREDRVKIFYGDVPVVDGGVAVPGAGRGARREAAKKRFAVRVDLGAGRETRVVYTTDITPEYVTFNMGE